jgi:parvulin-like peptidyl-prolyl isomerase
VLLLAAPHPAVRSAVIEEIVAKVNNRIISKSEFEERGEFILRQIYQEFSGEELDRQLKEAQDSMLANMITELLLLERAESLLDLDKVRRNLVDDFRKQQGIPSEEELARLLKEQGMARRDLEEQLVRMAIPQEVINYEVKRKISVSDAEIRKYYAEHARDWEVQPTATFREIVLFYEPSARTEVLERAAGLVGDLKNGAEFLEVLRRVSEGASKDSEGLLGPLKEADLHPAIAAAVFALDPSQVSDPIDTGRSIHIIRLEAKTPFVVKTLEEVGEAVADAVRQQKMRPRYDRYLKNLWKASHVEVLPKYQHFLLVSPVKPPE